MLACQMAAIHKSMMTAVHRLTRAQVLKQQDSASNMVSKLARTYTTQMETLKRYRSTGEQKIRVQYVTVNEGGQAIVGNVMGRGASRETRVNPMHLEKISKMNAAERCKATSKRSGRQCRAPAVRGKRVCRMHDARAGAPMGEANGAWRHGTATNERLEETRCWRAILKAARSGINGIDNAEAPYLALHACSERRTKSSGGTQEV